MGLRTLERPADRRRWQIRSTIGRRSDGNRLECQAKAKDARNRSAGANSNKSSRLLGEKNLGDFMGGGESVWFLGV